MIINTFTVCISSEIPLVLQLKKSILAWHPDWTFDIFLMEYANNLPLSDKITILDFETIPNFQQLQTTYSLEELRSYLKAFCSKKLLQQTTIQAIAYLHPATKLSSSLAIFESPLQQANILLFPLLSKPLLGSKSSLEKDYLNRGLINPNAWAVKNSSEGHRFIDWLHERLLIKGQTNLAEGLGSERLWLMHSPVFFEKVQFLPNRMNIIQLPEPLGKRFSLAKSISDLLKKCLNFVWTWQPF